MKRFVYIYVMSRSANTASIQPRQVEKALEQLGRDLRVARARRGESLRTWAPRIGVSVPTLQRMESGDPSVGMSVYATALWLIGRINDLAALGDPSRDQQALDLELSKIARGRHLAAKPKER
jgi:hypothetical protein